MSKQSLFFSSKHKNISRIISLKSPSKAHISVTKLKKMFDRSSRDRKVLIIKSTNLASNRANAISQKNSLSDEKRSQFREIGMIYNEAQEYFSSRLE